MSAKTGIVLRGFFRLQLGEDRPDGKPKIVGDSGWQENQVVNEGFQDYVCKTIGAIAGSKQATTIQIGTGTAPNVTHTTLDGSIKAGTCSNSVIASKTLQATVGFASTDHPGGTPTIQNIALINSQATIMCGNTYATSVWNSNQGLSATYQLRFATA
jgi:hypothetical protein